MTRAIHISGILLFVSFAIIFMDDFNQEWKRTQGHFSQIEENRFHAGSESELPFDPGIAQIVVDGLDRIDRCPTCHLGVNDGKYRKAGPPFNTHSGTLLGIHPSKDFGCTSCHFGQGYAVTYKQAAHRVLEFWNETMLPLPLIQASCGTCHLSEEVPEAEMLTGGRLLIQDKGCVGCHDINPFFAEEIRGPDLDGVGNKARRAWLYHWLKNPKEYLKDARMPTYRLSDQEILDLVEFLLSLDAKSDPPHPVTLLPSVSGDPEQGQILVSQSRCISCHAIEERGGKLAPELGRAGDKVNELWLANFLRNVHYYQSQKIMLEYNFTDQNALDVAAYILTEFSEEEYQLPDHLAEAGAPLPPFRRQERVVRGEQLFAKFGCGGCHSLSGRRPRTKVGPKLTNIGSRLASALDFGRHEDIQPTLYNWIYMKLKQPDVFDSAAVMPHYYLSDREAFEITIALLGNQENRYAREYLVEKDEHSLYKKPAGEFGALFERYSCISCHSIDRYGGTISTAPLTIEGSKVRFEWLRDYLLQPYAIRPVLTERMPQFRMTEKEASLMADYIKTVYVSDNIPRFFEYELTRSDAAKGEKEFNTLGCINCHILRGTGGYVGPVLDEAGSRLEAGWVYEWLLHPLEYKPETIHPDYGLSEAEARQLTAFLMTRRKGPS